MMGSFLTSAYPWVLSFHVISVIAWMAGLFYLPRLYVYHAERTKSDGEINALFQTMERRLFRVIMIPAMVATWVFGLMLVFTPDVIDWSAVWPWTKAGAVLVMTWFHHWLGLRHKDFLNQNNSVTVRQFLLMNEVPTVLVIIIVVSVIARPF